MVEFLVLDVSGDLAGLSDADRECTVAVLPSEVFEALGLEPFAGAGFDLFDDLGDGQGSGEIEEEADVVLDAANLDGVAADVAEDAAGVGKEFGSDG